MQHNKPSQNAVANNTMLSFSKSKIYGKLRKFCSGLQSPGQLQKLCSMWSFCSLAWRHSSYLIKFFSMQKLEAPRGVNRIMKFLPKPRLKTSTLSFPLSIAQDHHCQPSTIRAGEYTPTPVGRTAESQDREVWISRG